ncbi:MAG: TspO protein [Candidatus Yanofskybacteria bacterium RIFCSPHIGHO2_02_FULL_44_12b]|uniref:TspO protein n=1 Tax=Candidatus Yanofskybacteria bacterium RIFCSPLOWO2_01_FULL_44_22 TaxID=1802697 RepID=A0A1F8GMA5_9BACT|nr:MAG: TspO protein [Candidatus Yanofskybacteria bacterium RIFCSPHIGHO2_01_FULL_44_24]OGN16494.1 MAG: TspO protein [Candidatus Yanofskybacteria bacterium RIFCSPHIGHO2_02_FULL_44_12b]OGN26100.1 MAG: TspO protein [Candidatus Yanofskybacteria bacterium RIFCSPLOWO2_01_FULL_44_22]
MRLNNFWKLAIAIAITETAGIVGSLFTVSEIPGWYTGLIKPALNPPGYIFGPTWTILYALMGIAAFLIWKTGWEQKRVKIALGIFILQLLLNAAWSIIFFGLHSPFWALIDIAAMWLAVIWTMVKFYPIRKKASYLLLPYIAWIAFAAYLNYMIWVLN